MLAKGAILIHVWSKLNSSWSNIVLSDKYIQYYLRLQIHYYIVNVGRNNAVLQNHPCGIHVELNIVHMLAISYIVILIRVLTSCQQEQCFAIKAAKIKGAFTIQKNPPRQVKKHCTMSGFIKTIAGV